MSDDSIIAAAVANTTSANARRHSKKTEDTDQAALDAPKPGSSRHIGEARQASLEAARAHERAAWWHKQAAERHRQAAEQARRDDQNPRDEDGITPTSQPCLESDGCGDPQCPICGT